MKAASRGIHRPRSGVAGAPLVGLTAPL
jgi:hypothetical protein